MSKTLKHIYNHIKGRTVQSGLIDGSTYFPHNPITDEELNEIVYCKDDLFQLQKELKDRIYDEDKSIHIIINDVFDKFLQSNPDEKLKDAKIGLVDGKLCVIESIESQSIPSAGKVLSTNSTEGGDTLRILEFNDWLDWLHKLESDMDKNKDRFSQEYNVAMYNAIRTLEGDLRNKFQSKPRVGWGVVGKLDDYPHDERCEGSMCYCKNRAMRERPHKSVDCDCFACYQNRKGLFEVSNVKNN